MKQTAVEWLFKQLWEQPKDKFTWNAILSKAKEMEKQLEQEATLISEAVADVIIIARLNDEETARKLIREQFVVINRQDIDGSNTRYQLCNHLYNKEIIPKEEPKQETNLKKHLDSCEEYQGPRRSAIVGKQETLEEAAERYTEEHKWEEQDPWLDFMEGAKWQQQRM